MAAIHARRARALVGTRFRPQGRDVAYGLDCVGLAAAVYWVSDLPADYRLRGAHECRLLDELKRRLRTVRQALPGDLLMLRVAAEQTHLAVKTDAGFVHADAGARRVVEVPGAPAWPVVAVFRARLRKG